MTHPFAPDFRAQPYWWDAAPPSPHPAALPASGDIVVVGGGYAGLSAALSVQRLGRDAVVLDAERIGWGASSRNGGMVSGGLKLASGALEQRFGATQGTAIAIAAAASFPFIEALIAREGIDCEYVRCGRFMPAWTPAHHRALAAKAPHIADITGLPTRMVARADQRAELGSDFYHGGMVAEATGSLHPGRYARGLAEAAAKAGATLVDGVRVAAIRREAGGFVLHTDRGAIEARHVLVATNGYSAGARGHRDALAGTPPGAGRQLYRRDRGARPRAGPGAVPDRAHDRRHAAGVELFPPKSGWQPCAVGRPRQLPHVRAGAGSGGAGAMAHHDRGVSEPA